MIILSLFHKLKDQTPHLMKPSILSVLFCFLLIGGCRQEGSEKKVPDDAINPVIGDISYIEAFGERPGGSVDEEFRIRTHLKYVEKRLRAKDVSGLSAELREKRSELLDKLREYRKAGEFPSNFDHEERTPCFIDEDGNICAVGYLVAQTAGWDAAEKIASAFNFDRIHEMDLPLLTEWVANSGLTLNECAMIQPAYGIRPTNPSSPEYEMGTALLGGVNATMITLNAMDLSRGRPNRIKGSIGLATGVASATLGVVKYDMDGTYPNNRRQQTLSLINIGIGTATTLVSGYSLIKKPDPLPEDMSLNLYSYPTMENSTGVGFSLSKRF